MRVKEVFLMRCSTCIKIVSFILLIIFYFFSSPQIKAASEKLSELKDQSSSSGSTTPTVPSSTPLSMPSGDSEALHAQKQRFEELKVSQQIMLNLF